MSIEEIFQHFQVDKDGLSTKEVHKRLLKYGLNVVPRKERDSLLLIFFKELLDPIVLLLLVAIIASLLVGEVVDAVAIFVIIMIDLIIGIYEQNKANTTIQALSKLVPETSNVIRDGKVVTISSNELTIGDFVLLESGDKISADLRIVEAHNFAIDESILTGESLPVEKNSKKIYEDVSITSQSNMAFAGTSVVMGRGKAIVVNVGIKTEIGKIATTIHETKEEKSPLTIRIEKFSKQITLGILFLGILLAFLLYIKGFKTSEILVSVIALAVSAMPEGLPLALTMALTIASNKMSKKNVVVKELNSVESLGSCTVIASDKTGTLTVNEQTAKKIVLPNGMEYLIEGSGYSVNGKVVGEHLEYAKELIELGVINNEAKFSRETILGDSIDLAFLVLGRKIDTNIDDVEILETIPYESQNKYSAVFYRKNKEVYCTMKGSLETVLSFCNRMNMKREFNKELVIEQNDVLSKDGYRVIGVACGKVSEQDEYTEESIQNLTFMGLVGFIDPVRKDAIKAIEKCNMAGIKVLMITGDHPLTAFKIGKDLKLTKEYEEVVTGVEVEEALNQGDTFFDLFVKSKKIFARVTPIQKLRIVESLKRQGEFVAVTGDGVNDAPALRSANIGIAMGSGTDIAKETSKMIILDDNFKSIVSGVLEGRVAYANIRKITYFLLSCGFAEVLFFALSIFCNMPMPLVAIQLLWLNVVTDGIQDIALSFEKAERDIMSENPRNPKENLFDTTLIEEIVLSGFFIGFLVFSFWWYLLEVKVIELSLARSYIMALMIIIQNIHTFNCRSEKLSIFSISWKSNPIFILGIFGSLLLGLAVIEIDFLSSFLKTSHIPYQNFLGLFGLGFIILFIMESYKKIKYHTK